MEFITLKNKNEVKIISDVILYPLKINQDESGGILVETLRTDWTDVYGKGREFFMQYYSVTPSGAARDENTWHFHPNYQEDRFLVIQGAVVTAVADNRENSETKNLLNLFYMDALDDPYLLLIPKRVLHGFMVVSKTPSVLLNFPTALYNPSEEKRIDYEKANVNLSDGSAFSWNKVREEFNLSFPQ